MLVDGDDITGIIDWGPVGGIMSIGSMPSGNVIAIHSKSFGATRQIDSLSLSR